MSIHSFSAGPFIPIGQWLQLSNQSAALVAGEIPPAVLALLKIFSGRAGRKLPPLACEVMQSRVDYHPRFGSKAGLYLAVREDGPNRVKVQ
jgi:hypothetical protein